LAQNSILIIDDNIEFLNSSIEYLTCEMNIGLITWAVSPEEAEDKFYKYNPGLVILDLGMNKLKGQELSSWFKSQINAPKIMITSFIDNSDYRDLAREIGAHGFLKKDNFRAAFSEVMQFLDKDLNKIFTEHKFTLN
jgi:DNA-binding NarL/FixJ family response regulator